MTGMRQTRSSLYLAIDMALLTITFKCLKRRRIRFLSHTCGFPYVQHVTDDLLGVLQRFAPGHLDGGCGDGLSFHLLRGARQPICPQHREARAGLAGAGAVLGDALVNGFILLTDPIDCERAKNTGRGNTQAVLSVALS